VFLSNDDAKELTMEAKEVVLKLHRYFAHINAKKLYGTICSFQQED
jgi:hypothetical protein